MSVILIVVFTHVATCFQVLRQSLHICHGSTHPVDLALSYASQSRVQEKVLSASQQIINGVELWAVAHVLVHIQNVAEDAGGRNNIYILKNFPE